LHLFGTEEVLVICIALPSHKGSDLFSYLQIIIQQ